MPARDTLMLWPWLGASVVVQMQTSRTVPNEAPPARPDKDR